MRKIINSATTQYEPVLTEELVLDDRPISGSFNSITSDAVYKAISVDPGNVPPVESTDNGKVLTASYGEGGGSFEWATPSSGGSTYTAGDGIAISAQNEISAKVGGGIVIGNASSTSTVTDNLSVTPVSPEGTRIYPIFGRLTADTANALASGSVTIKSLINWSNNTGATYYRPCIFTYDSYWGYNTQNRLVFGTNAISGSITANTEIVYDINDVNASLSDRLTIETVLANPTNYVFFAVPCSSDGTPNYSAYYYSSASSTAAVISTASYQGTVTVPNSIILERPVPAYNTTTDVGKVLTVTATGLAWVTPGT